MGVGFAKKMSALREDLCKSLPMLERKDTVFQMLYFVIQALERCRSTTTAYPGKRSPWAMIHGFEDPEVLFFDGTTCHIASQSISCILRAIRGSSVVAAMARIQEEGVVRATPQSCARHPKEDFPKEDTITLHAFCKAVSRLCRASPPTKV